MYINHNTQNCNLSESQTNPGHELSRSSRTVEAEESTGRIAQAELLKVWLAPFLVNHAREFFLKKGAHKGIRGGLMQAPES
jgi:hypothetical protein